MDMHDNTGITVGLEAAGKKEKTVAEIVIAVILSLQYLSSINMFLWNTLDAVVNKCSHCLYIVCIIELTAHVGWVILLYKLLLTIKLNQVCISYYNDLIKIRDGKSFILFTGRPYLFLRALTTVSVSTLAPTLIYLFIYFKRQFYDRVRFLG